MNGPTCPLPITDYPSVLLAHGGGGRLMQELLSQHVLPGVSGTPIGDTDAAMLGVGRERVAFTTDSYVVKPLFFPGGDIGTLAVCGTVNDLAMVGATPLFLSLSLILEEGFPLADLDRILASVRRTAEAAGVAIVTGDTKVVDRGKGDGVFLNTAGIGRLRPRVCDRAMCSSSPETSGATASRLWRRARASRLKPPSKATSPACIVPLQACSTRGSRCIACVT